MQSTTAICPSLFNAAIAQDGILSRIRIPCGIISRLQVEAIAHLVQQYGDPISPHAVQITNRANLQIRSDRPLSLEMLHYLQDNGLAAKDQRLDGLRNIMTSPTAGIDPQALIDPRLYAQQWEDYLISHPELAILSAKFSVCFDGGELVNVADRPNDICLVAIAQNDIGVKPKIYFHLHLGIGDRGSSPTPTGILIEPSQVITYLAAFTEIYREYTQQFLANPAHHQLGKQPKPPRLRQLIKDWGIDSYHQPLTTITNSPLPIPHYQSPTPNHQYNHLGIHPQKTSPNPNLQQSDLVYIGVVIPLGRLSIGQLMGLSQIAQTYGNSPLRLTPWQNILITDIPKNQVDLVVQAIANLGLTIATTDPYAAIVACSGCTGCKSAHTDTQSDAQAIAIHLHQAQILSQPINIHLSGCDKSCAQHYPSDIALVGIPSPERSLYRVYVGDRETHFGTELYAEYAATDLPQLITDLISTYQNQTSQPNLPQNLPSFREFANTLTHA